MTSLVDANTRWMHACNPPTHSTPVPHAWEAAAGGRPAVVGPHQPPLEVSSPSPRSAAFASICHTPTTTHTFVRIPVPPFCSERHAYPCAPPSSPQAASIFFAALDAEGIDQKAFPASCMEFQSFIWLGKVCYYFHEMYVQGIFHLCHREIPKFSSLAAGMTNFIEISEFHLAEHSMTNFMKFHASFQHDKFQNEFREMCVYPKLRWMMIITENSYDQ